MTFLFVQIFHVCLVLL